MVSVRLMLPMLALVTAAAPAAEEVGRLPGWTHSLPSKMYSGFVNVTAGMRRHMLVHYWYVESEGAPETDPTILWSNGGPGASSMFGLLVELGPLLLNEESVGTAGFKATGVPTLFANANSWSKLGSILMFDWPPPVGFSFCDGDPSGGGTSCGDWDDERTAKLSYLALQAWFDKFPHRRANDLYLTGESYAGIYVPKLAQQILLHNDPKVRPQLKGFAVGDGCLGTKTQMCGSAGGPWYELLFLYGHGQLSNSLYDEIVSSCGMKFLKQGGTAPPGCEQALSQIKEQVGGYYAYGLYDDCVYSDGLRRRRRLSGSGRPNSLSPPTLAGALNDYVCGGGPAQNVWVNQTAVRAALNVPLHSAFFEGDNGEGMVYHQTEPSLISFYKQVASSTDLRVLVYNGDTDPGLNSFRAEEWTASLGKCRS